MSEEVGALRQLSLDSFVEHWEALGFVVSPEEVHRALILRYQEPHRGHHGLKHIADCLNWTDRLSLDGKISCSHEMALAFWFHDAVYEIRATDNELRSANWFRGLFRPRPLHNTSFNQIVRYILVTKLGEQLHGMTEMYVHDIDWWVVGSSAERYSEYAAGVRAEYLTVYSDSEYSAGRKAFLEQALEAGRVFKTEFFEANFGHRALQNIKDEIAQIHL